MYVLVMNELLVTGNQWYILYSVRCPFLRDGANYGIPLEGSTSLILSGVHEDKEYQTAYRRSGNHCVDDTINSMPAQLFLTITGFLQRSLP